MIALRNRRYLPVWLILGIGTCLTAVASTLVWQRETDIQRLRLSDQADRMAAALQQRINSNLEVLPAFGSLYAASNHVTRQDFSLFVQNFFIRHSSISALNWSRRIAVGDRTTFEQSIRAEGYPSYQIWERNANGDRVPVQGRAEFFPITYVEPMTLQSSGLGFDVGSEPVRRSALERARDSGSLSTTERIQIVTTGQVGFLVFQPVYKKQSAINNLPSRRENFLGAITGVFELSTIIKATLPQVELNHVNFYLFDNSASEKSRFLLFYDSAQQQLISDPSREPEIKGSNSICADLARCTRRLYVGDRQWSLLVLPSHSTILSNHWGALGLMLSGLMGTVLLASYVRSALQHTIAVERLVQERTDHAQELSHALQTLQKTQAQLIQTEKMSGLGQLVAGVAHEINNPVNFIHGNLNYANQYVRDVIKLVQLYQQHYPVPASEITAYIEAIDLEFLIEDLAKLLTSMGTGTDRIRQIVLSLRNFSRFDQAEVKAVDIHEGIDSTLMILQNRLKAKSDRPEIQVIKQYSNLPSVECYAGQLNQVFMNLLSNAIDALDSMIEEHPISDLKQLGCKITIHTEVIGGDRVLVRIADTGMGMTEDVKKRLFDPFFTTKPVGKGTGLGLSISYQIIVEKHHGDLRCLSDPGKGTEFQIEIPLYQSELESPTQFSKIATA